MALSMLALIVLYSAFMYYVLYLLSKNDKQKQTKNVSDKAIVPTGALRTVKDVLDSELKNVPKGCMWNVEKEIRPYRKVGNGYVFDGSATTVFVSVALIAPDGLFESFDIPLEDGEWWLDLFKNSLRKKVLATSNKYNQAVAKEVTKRKHLEHWEGVYQEGME